MDKTKYNDTCLNLEILSEEASEIIEVLSRIIRLKSKIIRFGLTDYHPKNGKQNNQALEKEIGHFEAILNILTIQGVLSIINIDKEKQEKLTTLGDYYFPIHKPIKEVPIEQLKCCLCGKDTVGRQRPNLLKGQGICTDCYSWLELAGIEKHLTKTYGDKGYHFGIVEV